jgi:hypothetical protein
MLNQEREDPSIALSDGECDAELQNPSIGERTCLECQLNKWDNAMLAGLVSHCRIGV